jgi:hypothetical protein
VKTHAQFVDVSPVHCSLLLIACATQPDTVIPNGNQSTFYGVRKSIASMYSPRQSHCDKAYHMPTQPRLTVIVPIYNEAEALPDFLPQLIATCQAQGWQLILVNDGSKDASQQCLEKYQQLEFVKIIRHKVNRGYGGALKSGILQAKTSHLITIDGDGQHSVDDIQRTFAYALENDADLVVGNRGRWQNASPYRELGKWLIRRFARILMPLPIQDLNSGFKLYQTALVQRYQVLCPNSMAFSDVIALTFISQNHLVMEIPITVRERATGKSTIGLNTAVDTVLEILNLALLFNPLKVFLPLALTCMLLGGLWSLPFLLMGRGVSVAGMLLVVLGALLFAIGLIVSQISALRLSTIEKEPIQQKET